MTHRFTAFSATHAVTVLTGLALLALLLGAARLSDRAKTLVTGILAFLNLTAYGYTQWAWSCCDHATDLDNIVPFHLCDVSSFLAGFALLTRKQLACELIYYWGLAAATQALLTPAIGYSFPHPTYFTFFTQHFAIVGAALYLPICEGWRPLQPFWRSPLRAMLWVNVYFLFACIMNRLLDTNFAYLANPPPNPSLIDHLGPWPNYIIFFEVIACMMFLILTIPFLKKNQQHGAITG
jgi:hypothetical integral membrane protein (TIGR02206 family)